MFSREQLNFFTLAFIAFCDQTLHIYIYIYIYILVLDPCYARATVVRARFLAAAFSDGSYLAHVNSAYLRHVKFCIVRGPPLFIVSPISQRGPLPRLVQSPRRRTPASTTGLNHATNHPQPTNPQTSINNPLNPSGVGLGNFFCESQSHLYPHMRAKFGRGLTVMSKKGSLKFISRYIIYIYIYILS